MRSTNLQIRVCFAAVVSIGFLSAVVYISAVMSPSSNHHDDRSDVATAARQSIRTIYPGTEADSGQDKARNVDEDNHSKETEEQPVCKYPDLKMSNPEINHLFFDQSHLHCGGRPTDYLTYLDRETDNGKAIIRLNSSALLPGQKLVSCRYIKMDYLTDWEDNTIIVHTKNFQNNNETLDFPFEHEFARVICHYETEIFSGTGTEVVVKQHNNMFQQVKKNPTVERRSKQLYDSGRTKEALGGGLNVLMVGVDSTSRMNFMRKLPETFQYFTETLQGYVLKGYHVIGDGTTAQFIGMFTGFLEDELPNTKRGTANATLCDVFPLIWRKYKRKGYVTMFGEDEAWTGTFQYRTTGFSYQPTDHYMRPFWLAIEHLPGYRYYGQFCVGATPKHHYTFQYMRDFVDKYNQSLKFASAFHSQLSHDSVNLVQAADQDILDLISSWNDKGYLDNTVLIVFADHGARYGEIRQFLQGRLEERLPFFGIAIPKWIKQKHPEIAENLRKNQERLTTAFDFHKMLQHILDYPGDPSNFQGHGISLFREIPLNRTCEDAKIADHWCTCLQTISMSTSNDFVRASAKYLVSHINSLTLPHRNNCMELSLKNITHAEIVKPNKRLLQFQESTLQFHEAKFGNMLRLPFIDFMLTVETEPNGGMYEASVRKWLKRNHTEVMADISRINRYGDHPKCIRDKFPRLRKYCYCREFFQPTY
ncbi:Hypp2015 [Branchiostoma lanceolatum]|uniref:Hypp2015 protein n=1 Tax=Branchiostoma lanceolatum TaxID=7740 RepID=A0A8J9ZN15_BRALA|nr:Hypp2015 [Branchiostoma lanceolatum]